MTRVMINVITILIATAAPVESSSSDLSSIAAPIENSSSCLSVSSTTAKIYFVNYNMHINPPLAIVGIRDVTIHDLDVSIYCHLCIMIQRYIELYNQE